MRWEHTAHCSMGTIRCDLKWFREFLNTFNTGAVFDIIWGSYDIKIYADASLSGWGGPLGQVCI